MLTAILLSWKRKQNLPQIIEALRAQTVEVEIWLINNDGFDDWAVDRSIFIPWNAGEWARYVFAARAETEFCIFQDDDFLMTDEYFIEDALQLHSEKCPDHILGVAGRGIQYTHPHYWPDYVRQDAYVQIVKGHFQLFRTDMTRRIKLPNHPSASDIYWSLDAADGEALHYISKNLSYRMRELERFGVGYEFRKEHYQERAQAVVDWIKENKRMKEHA